MKTVVNVVRDIPGHWVGDGFPVRSMFSYGDGNRFDPFLLLDYAGPYEFTPTQAKRGVGEHPHRGFETVTIVYEGEVDHGDSTGSRGTISTGDVQWMTAASGVVHEEFHSERFAREGGLFEMVQLWVNLPAQDKKAAPGYQSITADQIPVVPFSDGHGRTRVIAGNYQEHAGAASTFTPINLWDVIFDSATTSEFTVPEGHTAVVIWQKGTGSVNGTAVKEVELAELAREGKNITLRADGPARALILTGEPIGEPVVGHGPFVMNTREEISEAIRDFQSGKMGRLTVN